MSVQSSGLGNKVGSAIFKKQKKKKKEEKIGRLINQFTPEEMIRDVCDFQVVMFSKQL